MDRPAPGTPWQHTRAGRKGVSQCSRVGRGGYGILFPLRHIGGLAVMILACRTVAGEDLFATHPVWRIEIELTPQNIERLRAESRSYVPASIRAFGEVFRDVGVRLKGTGSYRPLDDKPSFTLDFAKFVRGQALRGLQKIHLNNAVQDSTYLREQIGAELFLAAQVPVPRVAHALVTLNGRELGLYVVKEGFTQEFLRRHFVSVDGYLYDTDNGHDVDERMKRHLGQNSTDAQIDLQRLAAAAMEPDLSRRWEHLQHILDMDRIIAFMTLELMICHWHGYCLGRNNFRIYHDPQTDKIIFLPSGMDQIFSKADMPWKPEMAGLVVQADQKWRECDENICQISSDRLQASLAATSDQARAHRHPGRPQYRLENNKSSGFGLLGSRGHGRRVRRGSIQFRQAFPDG